MKTRKFVVAILGVVLMAAIFAQADVNEPAVKKEANVKKIDLKLNLKKGQKFGMLMTTDMKVTQSMMGQEIKVSQLSTMGLNNEVLNVDANGIISLKMVYTTMKMKMDTPAGPIEYDSTKPEQDVNRPQAKMMIGMYSAMLGQELIMKINPKGKVVGIEGYDAMMDKMAQKMGALDPNAIKAMKDMLKNFMNENKIEQMSNGMMAAFPEGPVGIGDMWHDIVSFDIGFPMDVDTTYVLKDRKSGVALMDVISKMDMGADDSKLIEINGMKINMQMTGGMQGDMEVDEATGWMLRSKTNMQFSGVMKIAASPQMPEGMAIPMTIIGTVTAEPLEIKN